MSERERLRECPSSCVFDDTWLAQASARWNTRSPRNPLADFANDLYQLAVDVFEENNECECDGTVDGPFVCLRCRAEEILDKIERKTKG